MTRSVLSKAQMKAQIMEWLDNDRVIERVYYFVLAFRGM